jgi:hypothetical protein
MKLLSPHSNPAKVHRQQGGSAVIVVMALVAILLLYVAGNLRTLDHLSRELKLLEKKQVRRLQATYPLTNSTSLHSTNAAALLNLPK